MTDAASRALVVRPAGPGDRDTVTDFNIRLALESEGLRLEPAVVRAGVERVLADSTRGLYFLAEVDGMVAGQTLITYEWSDWRNGWFWWIQSVYVHPDHRRRGVFRALHEFIASRARRDAEICGLRLYVDRRNEQAMRTYERLGMRPGGYLLYEIDWSAAVGPAHSRTSGSETT
jgi:ribosomal protein S18 acetylase RimI-like enzyme